MQQLAYILFQLDEARRYIEDGRLPHLRLAFLLLDNAAEIQMDRRIREDWSRDELREKLRKHALLIPAKDRGPHLEELTEWVPLSRSEKLKIDRYFDEKVTYMTERGGHLDASLAGPLKYLHRYRNEAYHRARVRTETIRTAALVLLEITCQMILTISPAVRSIGSNEDYSWLQERFGWNPWSSFLDDVKLRSIIDEIRSGVLPSDESVAITLADHLQNRFTELDDALTFMVENLGRVADKEAALRESQYYAELQKTGEERSRPSAMAFAPKYTLRSIQGLATQVSHVNGAPIRLDAFDRFSSIERDLEPIEECVHDLAVQIDMAIQAEIDRMRGK